MTSLRNILLLQRDVKKAVAFYKEGLGLKLTGLTEKWAAFEAGGSILSLQEVEGEALCTTGYSPILNFEVEDLQGTLMRLIESGGVMDGPVQYPLQGKIDCRGEVATVRAPDGHMISLFERAPHRGP